MAIFSVINGISLDNMLDYISGATSLLMCFIIPFTIYHKLIKDDPSKRCESMFFFFLIVVFVLFQILKIISFFY